MEVVVLGPIINFMISGRLALDGFLAKNYPGREEEMFFKLAAAQPIGRMGKPEEIAQLALYLCSDEASFITGSDFTIDGGATKLSS